MDSLGKVSRVWVSLYEKFLGHSALLEGLCRLHMFGIPFYMRCQFVLFCCKNDIGQGSSNPALGRGECGTCKSGRCLAASFQYTWSLVPHSRGIGSCMPSPFSKLDSLLQPFSKRNMRDIINKFVYMFVCYSCFCYVSTLDSILIPYYSICLDK